MARAASRPVDSEALKLHPELDFNLSPYKYQLITANGQSVLRVSNGTQSKAETLEWALGDDRFGQSYVFRDQGKYYESQLSFYRNIDGLDITTGHSMALPQSLGMAAGGYTSPETIRQCFGCHFTASTENDRFDPDQAVPGVTCEACHGPGLEHVTLMSSGTQKASGSIMDLEKLSPVDSVDFCGACHRTYSDAVLQGLAGMGVINVRLQPYRLEKSKCWGKGDARITCVACHDPHVEIVRGPEAYDSKCLRCHSAGPDARPSADHPGRACPVASKNCVTCHMPKIDVPGTHTTFTDHMIRIVRPGAPYPG
jgi:hypothetical protein